MNFKNPKVSIIIPVHNRIKELKRAVDSIRNQSYKNYEVIIVDDCSTDKIKPQLFNKINDIKIEIINLSTKSNANFARNIGFKKSSGDYLAFLDSDDEWKENHLQYNLDFINENELDGVYGGIEIHKSEEKTIKIPRNLKQNELFENYIFNGGLCQTSTFIIKKKCFKEIQFDESLSRHQDWDFGIRFYNHFNFKPNNIDSVIVHWEKLGKQKINLESSKIFINKYKLIISNKSYFTYHRNMYHLSKNLNYDTNTKNYFLKNSLLYFEELSKTDFMSIYNPVSFYDKIYYNLLFVAKKNFRRRNN
jgi:glycosyltransferase involved in cell wall biosynthesis